MASVPRPMRRTRLGPRGQSFAAAVAVVVLGFSPAVAPSPPAVTVVRLGAHTVSITGTPTVGRLLAQQRAAPRPGRLLDLRGAPIGESSAAVVLRNGAPASSGTLLASGDVVDVRDGADANEPAVVETYDETGGNPQFLLGGGSITVRRGLISGEIEPVATTAGSAPPAVALTFDDGPNPGETEAILAELEKAGAKATFFVLGSAAERYPDIVKREIDAGMAVGNHTWSHKRLVGRPPDFVIDEMQRAKAFVDALGGHVAVFRPPYERFDSATVAIAESLGMRTVLWSVDPLDWTKPGAAQIVQRVLDKVRPGSVILLHDGGGDRTQTVEAVRMLIPALRSRGYALTTLD